MNIYKNISAYRTATSNGSSHGTIYIHSTIRLIYENPTWYELISKIISRHNQWYSVMAFPTAPYIHSTSQLIYENTTRYEWISKRISKHTEWYFSYDCSHGTICTDKSTLIQISAYENTTQYWWISKRKSKHIKWYLVMAPHSVHRWQQNFAKILVTDARKRSLESPF